MIRGSVHLIGTEGPIVFWEPRIEIAVAGVDMNFRTVQFVVDTGFNGALALPGDIIEELGLTQRGERRTRLATGHGSMAIYGAVASWFGDFRAVECIELTATPWLAQLC